MDVATLIPYILGAFGLSNYFLLTILLKAIRVRLLQLFFLFGSDRILNFLILQKVIQNEKAFNWGILAIGEDTDYH